MYRLVVEVSSVELPWSPLVATAVSAPVVGSSRECRVPVDSDGVVLSLPTALTTSFSTSAFGMVKHEHLAVSPIDRDSYRVTRISLTLEPISYSFVFNACNSNFFYQYTDIERRYCWKIHYYDTQTVSSPQNVKLKFRDALR